MTLMIRPARLLKFAALAAAGPITGPLLAGAVRHRHSAPVLSSLYAWLAVLTWIELPLLAKAMLHL